MSEQSIPQVAHYERAPETKEEIEYAVVPIIDFANVHTPEGRAQLAPQVRDAMRTYGFMCIVNHGLTQAQNDRMIDIADVPFSAVPADEQARFVTTTRELGEWKGYKPRQYWHVDNGVHDQIHHYMVVHPNFGQHHPGAVQPFLTEIHAFMEYNHFNVLHPVLQLLALGLELPEETFVEQHPFGAKGLTVLFAKYYPRTEEDELKTQNVWMKGHTDSGTITLLWSQPVIALQTLSPDGKWRFVKHVPNGIVWITYPPDLTSAEIALTAVHPTSIQIVNAGDAMEMLSGGYYKATIHRVFQPPPDQRGYTRLGLFYFAYSDGDVRLEPHGESPVLQRVGIVRRCKDEDAPTMAEFSSMRARTYGNLEAARKENGVSEQIVGGVVVRHYD
ncbi:hypothetical protein GSI_08670 [Ganoderma sinense ZZ0214-1]|uniref:Fe2OG dioxygenase domain-containing protein n=1 Tax=Ganoderma sinense ZZ0214-1 TaxID=1077348 RepID=A0A2G8S4Y7_9APHY|nr:hypothetical protein GSI_08670 [Ganoderma sinense ZZ0214-1]